MSDRDQPEFQPYVPAGESPVEMSLKALVIGVVFGALFGAANAYLGLVAGLTISTSIPIAVMTVAAFGLLKKLGARTSILEANLTQTVGSASSSVASGVIFTLPALFMWGFPPALLQMVALATIGGLLGVLFMVPLRPYLMEQEHGRLPYPEGTACAEVLKATETGGARAHTVFLGLGVGAVFKALTDLARVVPNKVGLDLPLLPQAHVASKVSAALFGVGYILGPRVASIMVGGGLLSSLVLIPAIAIWGADRAEPLYPETVLRIAEMDHGELWTKYVRYIGAGAVAAGGIITLARSLPTMIQSFRVGAAQLRERVGAAEGAAAVERTRRDLPLTVVGAGALVLIAVMAVVPHLFGALESAGLRVAAALCIGICSFFFVTVSSRIVGLVGVTSNPTSGMTIASLLFTALVFLLLGFSGDVGKVAALSVGCVIAIAASIAGDTSQDLKTGFLLGATPRVQQVGELLGVLGSTAAVCWTVRMLDASMGFGSADLPAPQATLMKVVVEGVIDQNLPWGLIGIGVAIAVLAELARLPSLAFAVGVYLPVSTMVPVFLGGMLRMLLERGAATSEQAETRRERGTLFGSGLVGGAGLAGVAIAGTAYALGEKPAGIGYAWAGSLAGPLAVLLFGGLVALFLWTCTAGSDRGARRP